MTTALCFRQRRRKTGEFFLKYLVLFFWFMAMKFFVSVSIIVDLFSVIYGNYCDNWFLLKDSLFV